MLNRTNGTLYLRELFWIIKVNEANQLKVINWQVLSVGRRPVYWKITTKLKTNNLQQADTFCNGCSIVVDADRFGRRFACVIYNKEKCFFQHRKANEALKTRSTVRGTNVHQTTNCNRMLNVRQQRRFWLYFSFAQIQNEQTKTDGEKKSAALFSSSPVFVANEHGKRWWLCLFI